MPRGSLHELLHSAAGVIVDTAQAVRFALDIARGMSFLHSLERIIPEYFLNTYHVMVSFLLNLFEAKMTRSIKRAGLYFRINFYLHRLVQ